MQITPSHAPSFVVEYPERYEVRGLEEQTLQALGDECYSHQKLVKPTV